MSDDQASVLDEIFKDDKDMQLAEGGRKNVAENIKLAHKPQTHPRLTRGQQNKTMAKKKETTKRTTFNGVGKCAFIDAAFEKGGYTMGQIFDLAMNAFPGSDREKMMNNIKVRPYCMKRDGKNPQWVKPQKPDVAAPEIAAPEAA